MNSHPGMLGPRGRRRAKRLRPCLLPLEQRLVPAMTFPGIAGIAFNTAGDELFVSYDSTGFGTGQQQAVAEVAVSYNSENGTIGTSLESASVFGTNGGAAFPGTLTAVGQSAALPNISDAAGDIFELQPNGQLFVFSPTNGTSSQYDNLPNDTANASNVYDVQTGGFVNLSSQISLTNATYGDFGIYDNSLVVSAESNNWDFVMRVTYGSSSTVATVLVASPASDGLSDSPEGVAVDSQGTVLTTLPYQQSSGTVVHVPVGFSLFYDTGGTPQPFVPKLGLTTTPSIDAGAITVDSQNNFIIGVVDSSLYGGGAGVAHINSALDAFLADPLPDSETIPAGMTCQTVDGSNYLAYTDAETDTFTTAGELPLFSGQASPAQLRDAYGINQISFTGPGGTTVTGDGSGQTIAIVEEGVDPTLEADLTTFDQQFGIQAPPSFQVVDQNGVTTQNVDIVGEASLDVEWAHAVAPGASIVVYNAAYYPDSDSTSIADLFSAMKEASELPGVSVVTLSYGVAETSLAQLGLSEQAIDSDFTTPGVTFLAASGDSGIYGNSSRQIVTDYPASSPNIVSVGGTSIVIDFAGDYPGTGSSGETAWGFGTQSGEEGGSGGGLSGVEAEPAWQSGVVPASIDSIGARAVPDVAMDSGVAQEYDVFTSTLSGSSDSASAVGWLGDAGTSAASPIWAGLIAIADQGRALAGGTPLTGYTQTLPALYSLPSTDFHDIVNGNNGDPAGPGYDLDTGLGTPVANLLVPALADYGLASQMSIETEPPSAVVANSAFGLVVQVEDGLGNPANSGTVTVALGSNPGDATLLGTRTVPVENGLATFSNLSLNVPASGYTLTITDSSIAAGQTTTAFTVTAPSSTQSQATLSLSSLSVTYDGSPQYALVSTSPSGLSGVTISYAQNGVAVAGPTHAGDYTVIATLSNANYYATPVTGTLVIGQATPTLTWSDPANITFGTRLGSAQLDATATFGGTPLLGVPTYTPAAGTLLPSGNDQELTVSFAPADATDFTVVKASVSINVLPQSITPPPPPQVVVIGELPVFRRVPKHGRTPAKEILTGFRLDFNMPLAASEASNPANFQLAAVATKKVKKKVERVAKPITSFTVDYNPATDSVTLELDGTQAFPLGGQLTVLSGATDGSGGVLTGTTVFKITVDGKKIVPD
jgi:MBG domain